MLLGTLLAGSVHAQDVTFSTVASGQTKAITEWGIEVVQGNSTENARLSKVYMGEDEIDVLWSFFWPGAALTGGGSLAQEHKDVADGFIDGGAAALLPNAVWGFGPNINDTDAYFFPGNTFSSTRWADLVKKTVEYYQSRGETVAYMMPFNEADFWAGQGSPADLASIATILANDASLNGIGIMGPSTLSSGNAYNDYSNFGAGGASGPLTHGSTHHLQWYDSATAIADFYTYVLSQGDVAYNPEFHSMGEAIFSAQYGVTGGAWWGAALRSRGLFVQACQGDRLGYAENRGGWSTDYLTQSAAAVYRAPDGELYGFAGGFERAGDFGSRNPYRLVCTDRDVYFNGIGPMREYILPVRQFEDAIVDIDYAGIDIMPALDGHQWQIVNRQTGEVMEVLNGGTANGDNVRCAANLGYIRQKWDISRTRDGFFGLYNAKSGMPADLNAFSLSNGANIQQWSFTGNLNQYWFIESAGNGYYYIRNGHSGMYMERNPGGTNIQQWEFTGSDYQQWEFVLVDPAGSGTPLAHYEFEGNANDSAGSNHGTAFGSPVYTSGPVGFGQAIDLDGANDYVDLPNGIYDSDDITVATWVKWDGIGGSWQRIFDFGLDTDTYMFLSPSNDQGLMDFSITTGSYQYEDTLVTDALPVGQWVHVAVTLRGNTGILYIDGLPKVAGYIGINPSDLSGATQNNYIGKSQWPDPLFNGKIDDFRIYDYALTAAEVAALAGVTPDTTPPAAPTGLVATSGDGSVGLDWAVNIEPDLDSYTVYRSTTSGSNYVVVASGLASNTNTDNTVTNGTMYYYVVTASDSSANESAYSSPPVSVVPSAPIAPEEYTIHGYAIEAGTNMTLTVSNSVPGHTYGILATDTLTPAAWSNIMDEAGTGLDLQLGIPISPTSTNRFFKLDVQRQ